MARHERIRAMQRYRGNVWAVVQDYEAHALLKTLGDADV